MSCKLLAERYAKSTGSAIPVNGTKTQQADWLLKSVWTCTKPNSSEIEPDPSKCADIPTDQVLLKAKKNVLYETGFLAWLNEGGMKCVRQVTGDFYGRMDNRFLTSGKGEMADRTIPSLSGSTADGTDLKQTYYCNVACRAITAADSDPCLSCVSRVLTDFNHDHRPVQLCPGINNRLENGETLLDYMQECVTCQSCIAQQISEISTSTMTPDQIKTARQDAAWRCVTGQSSYNPNPFQWSPYLIVGITLAGILFLGLAGLFIWLYLDWKKNHTSKKYNGTHTNMTTVNGMSTGGYTNRNDTKTYTNAGENTENFYLM